MNGSIIDFDLTNWLYVGFLGSTLKKQGNFIQINYIHSYAAR